MAIPTKDSLLAAWSLNCEDRISTGFATFGLSSAQASTYSPLHDAFIESYNAASVPGARSKSLVAAKDTAKAALLAYARQLYAYVQANPSVTDANKELLGVKVRKTHPTPVDAPAFAPNLEIVERYGTTVRIRLHDGTSTRRRLPGAAGATVFSFIGANPPASAREWVTEGNTGRTDVNVEFDSELVPGTKVWLCAFWYSQKGEPGPGCAPVETYLVGGSTSLAA